MGCILELESKEKTEKLVKKKRDPIEEFYRIKENRSVILNDFFFFCWIRVELIDRTPKFFGMPRNLRCLFFALTLPGNNRVY